MIGLAEFRAPRLRKTEKARGILPAEAVWPLSEVAAVVTIFPTVSQTVNPNKPVMSFFDQVPSQL